MRLLFVNPYYKPYLGGIERIIEQLGVQLRPVADVEAIGVLTTRVHFPHHRMRHLPSYEIIDGIEVFRCSFWPARLPRIVHAAGAGYFSPDVPRVLRRFKPDLIHFTYSEWWAANSQIYLASRHTPHLLSTFFHDLPHNRQTALLYRVNRWLIRRMRRVHVLSQVEQEQVQHAYGAKAYQTVVIPPGITVPATAPERAARETVTILAVGRLNESKGQARLVEIVRGIIQRQPQTHLQLWLVGDDAGSGSAIASAIEQHGLAPVIHVFGHCTDQELESLYRQADIFALPTRYESFGLVFVEAMAHGLPVVTYGLPAVASVLRQGAILVPPGDEQALADALTQLINNPEKRQDLGREGREFAMHTYSWETTGQQFINLYRHLIDHPINS